MGTYRIAREYLKYAYRALELNGTVPAQTSTYMGLLTTGLSLGNGATIADIIAGEVIANNNGYTRQVVGRQISSIDTTGDLITISSHGYTANQQVYLVTTGSAPGGLAINTLYFVVNPTTNTFQLSLTSGGAAIDLTSTGSGTHYIKVGSIFDAGSDSREEASYDEETFSAVTNDITWQGYFVIIGGTASSSITVSSINTSTDEVTTSANHGLTTGDAVMITVDAGGTIPSGASGTTLYYARVVSATVITLHTTAAGASGNTGRLDITTAGSGTIRIRYANGTLKLWEYLGSPNTLSAGSTQPIRLNNNVLNAGNSAGV